MNGIKKLERQAIQAFRSGQGWSEFWERHSNEIRSLPAVEPSSLPSAIPTTHGYRS